MKIIKDVVRHNFTVETDTEISGIVSGNVQVLDGTNLLLSGIVSGNLTISQNGYAKISGIVSSNVINNGEIDVHGIVTGNITNIDGNVTIHKNAIVNGIKY